MKFKTKAERKEYIRSRLNATGLFAVAAFLATSNREIRQTFNEVKANASEAMNDEIRDEEKIGFKSGLSFDEIKEAKDHEENYELSEAERAELKRDRLAYKTARESVEGFSLPAPLEFA